VLAVITLAGVVAADPALGAGRGLIRVQDARVEEDGALVFANRWMFQHVALNPGATNIGPLYGLELSYSPFPFIEGNWNLVGVNQLRSSGGLDYDFQGYGLGGKFSIPWIPVLKLGVSGNWFIERKNRALTSFMNGEVSKNGYWRGLASLRLWELYKTLPTLMFNYGSDMGANPSKFAGVGIELATNALDYFIEANVEDDASFDFSDDPLKARRARLTPGVHIKFPYLHLDGGVEIGLNDSTPDYQVVAGISFVSPFPKPKPKPMGQIAGKVEDALTGKPLAAKIRFVNRRQSALKTDPKNGTFYIAKSPVGALLLEASSAGYISEAAPISVPDRAAATHTFRLRSAKPVGTIAGRVYDAQTKRPLVATVTVVDTRLEPVMSSENTGFFRFDNLPIGLYNIMVEGEGYLNDEQVVEVEEAKTAKLAVGLATPEPEKPQTVIEPIPAKVETVVVKEIDTTGRTNLTRPAPNAEPGTIITLRGVMFDFDRSDIREDGRPALLEAAQILNQNPGIKVEVRGYTDDRGSDEYNLGLSERRAQSVYDFLVREGVDGNRMTVRGYGETNFVASNDTEEGRQQNRRVDFVVAK
jgi:outer membrane protein OmpA-like peptidoglycan-associated protein